MSQVGAFGPPPDLLPETAAPPVGFGGAGPPPSRSRWRRPGFVRLLGVVAMVLLWVLIAAGNENVPGIGEVFDFLWIEITGGSHGGMVLRGEFLAPLLDSLQRYAIGLVIGIPLGVGLGLLLGASSFARGLLNDTTLALLALPTVVWAFLAFLWFGLTDSGPVIAVVLTVVPFVAVNVSAGVRGIDPHLVEMSRSFRVPWTPQDPPPAHGRDPAQRLHRDTAGLHRRLEQPADRGVVRGHVRGGLEGPVLVRRPALPRLRGLGAGLCGADRRNRPVVAAAAGAPGLPLERAPGADDEALIAIAPDDEVTKWPPY